MVRHKLQFVNKWLIGLTIGPAIYVRLVRNMKRIYKSLYDFRKIFRDYKKKRKPILRVTLYFGNIFFDDDNELINLYHKSKYS